MKVNIMVKGAAGLLFGAVMASCSSDYLELEPITSVDETRVTQNTENAMKGVDGIARLMYAGYNNTNAQFLVGEPYVNSLTGEMCGEDVFYMKWAPFGASMMNGQFFREPSYWMTGVPWMYAYKLINMANKILIYIDSAEGTQEERDNLKAQCLTYRAHCYVKLLQGYAPRWEDSNNGETLSVVLRLEPGTGDMPLSSMSTVLDQIYSDLDEAISLYDRAGIKRTYMYQPNKAVAQGIYARAALLKHDWQKAYDMAKSARADYPIMSGEEYCEGFSEPNAEWMWCNANDPNDPNVGYYSWGASFACNGAYVYTWGDIGAGSINYDTYKRMDKNDVRRALFWTPDKQLIRPLNSSSFWNSAYVEQSTMNMAVKSDNGSFTLMAEILQAYCKDRLPNGDLGKFTIYPYCNPSAEMTGIVPFGAQFKFLGQGAYSNSSYPYMRGGEMAMIEAEAAYELHNESAAKTALTDVNSKRIEGYACNTTGAELLDEIRWSRRFELWGEGFNYFDLKRWNMPMVRREWVEKDVNSGNIPPGYGVTVEPSAYNGWRFIIPDSERRYNSLVQ